MTDSEKRGGLATALYLAYLGILALAGTWVAPYVIFVWVEFWKYLKGKV